MFIVVNQVSRSSEIQVRERKLIAIKSYRDIPKWAVIVGISEYKHTAWNLNYAHRDAEELSKLLQTDNGGNFPQDNIQLLTNQKATKRNIEIALHDFLQQPAKDDLVLLYFACHGAPDPKRPHNKQLYLLTHDTEPNKIAATGLRMREINNCLQETLRAEKIVVLADTCHSGGINYREINYRDIDNSDTISQDNSAQVTRYLQQLNNSQGGVAIVTSAEATQKSQEAQKWGGGHGVFTHFILEGMRGRADIDNDGIVTAGELFEYVRENVKKATNNTQIPFIDANHFDRNLPVALTEIKNINSSINDDDSELSEDIATKILEELEQEDAEEAYRIAVREYLSGKEKVNYFEKLLLEKKAQELNLNFSQSQAEEILQEEINRNAQSKHELKQAFIKYENSLKEIILNDQYPFNASVKKQLKEIQNYLKLSDQQVETICKPILDQAEFINTKGNKKFSFEVITVNHQAQIIHRSKETARFFSEDLDNSIKLEMVAIPGGSFWIGTEAAEIERLVKKFGKEYFRRESPQHLVTIKPFFMGKYPVTQAQWQAIMGNNPAKFRDSLQHPVENVSWDDAQKFCQQLSIKTGLKYRLPSEAEWEYACRSVNIYQSPPFESVSVISGVMTAKEWNKKYYQPFHFGETITGKLANYKASETYAEETAGDNQNKTMAVGNFLPNRFGLYDMHGNVWEWCEDDWHENYHNAPNNGDAWRSRQSIKKVLRGGSWDFYSYSCRSAYRDTDNRDDRNLDIGFRAVCEVCETT